MLVHVEAGRADGRDRASECVLWRNASDVDQNPVLFNQAAYIASRFAVSASVSRVLAEHAFAGRAG